MSLFTRPSSPSFSREDQEPVVTSKNLRSIDSGFERQPNLIVTEVSGDGLKFLETAEVHNRALRTYGFGSGGYINLTSQNEKTLRNAFGFYRSTPRPYHWVHFLYALPEWNRTLFTTLAFKLVALGKKVGTDVIVDIREVSRWARRLDEFGLESDQWDIFRQKCEEAEFWNCPVGVFGHVSSRSLDESDFLWCVARTIVSSQDSMRLRVEATLFFDSDILEVGERALYAGVEILMIKEKPTPYPKFYDRTKKVKYSFFPEIKHTLFISFATGKHVQGLLLRYASKRGYLAGVHMPLSDLSRHVGVDPFPVEARHVFGYPRKTVNLLHHQVNSPVIEMLRGMVNLASSVARSHRRRENDDLWFGMLKVIFTEYGCLDAPVDFLMVDCFRRIIRAFGLRAWMTEAFAAIPLKGRNVTDVSADQQYLDGIVALSAHVCLFTRFGRGYVGSGFRHYDGEVIVTSETQTIVGLRGLVQFRPPRVWVKLWSHFNGVFALHCEVLDTFTEMGISSGTVLERARVLWPDL
jgi:hypothetical protein